MHNAVSTASPEAAQKKVSSVFFAGGFVAGTAGWASICFINSVTWVNQGFVTLC
jgi:hypothetical protein